MPNGKLYTKQEDDLIREHVGKLSAEKIGELLGRTRLSVQHRIQMLRLDGRLRGEHHPMRKINSLRAAMVITLTDAGFTPTEIYQVMKESCPVGFNVILEIANGFSWQHALEKVQAEREQAAGDDPDD